MAGIRWVLMRKKIFIDALLPNFIALIMIVGLMESCGQRAKDALGVSPVNISLELIPGTEKKDTLVILRLFSRRLQQQRLNGNTISPIELETAEGTWQNNITFTGTNEKGSPIEIDKKEVSLIRARKDKKMSFYPQTVIQIFYGIKPTARLIPGKELSATLHLDQYTLTSNKVVIPPLPRNKHDMALRCARINSLTNPGELLTTAESLIQETPESYLGYWYQGLALEHKKDYQGALNSYRTALQYYPQSTNKRHYEPPLYIALKIRQLRQFLSQRDR